MRLWHIDLLPVLPRQQLLGQNRECALIEHEILTKGKVNHLLVNFVNDDKKSLFLYHARVIDEMLYRSYNITESTGTRWNEFGKTIDFELPKNDIFPEIFDYRYLMQCYYNLQEKYDRGGITQDEWNPIKDKIEKIRLGCGD